MIKTPYFNWYGRGFKLRAAITIACQMAFILFGYDQGVFGGIVGNEHFLNTFGHPSPGLEGIIVAIYNLGCFTGCIVSFIFCEKTGRRLAMWIAMVWIIVSLDKFVCVHERGESC
jgi:MFS family permease